MAVRERMRRLCRRWVPALAAILVLYAAGGATSGRAQIVVDLELVLAVDASASIVDNTLDFQLAGHAAAFRDPRIIAAIDSGPHRRIAVTLVSWSDPMSFQVLIPWILLDSAASVRAFADRVEQAPRRDFAGSTGIGAAMLRSAALFGASGFLSSRRIIDLVSNGTSNIGIRPEFARDTVTAAGITVNGLVILDEVAWLADYFTASVVGGADCFVRVADSRASFARAILDKLAWEIATHDPPSASDRTDRKG